MSDKIKLSENVMLIDAAFLNFVTNDLKRHFERMLNRSLQQIDLSQLVTYLALDAGLAEGDNAVQIMFVYDRESTHLTHTTPADLKTELDGVAFKNSLGEFTFAGVPSAEMVTRGELFLDLLNIVADSDDVKRLVVVSFNEEYGDKVTAKLRMVQKKQLLQFRMNEPDQVVDYRWEFLAYPLMQALGIRSEEL